MNYWIVDSPAPGVDCDRIHKSPETGQRMQRSEAIALARKLSRSKANQDKLVYVLKCRPPKDPAQLAEHVGQMVLINGRLDWKDGDTE